MKKQYVAPKTDDLELLYRDNLLLRASAQKLPVINDPEDIIDDPEEIE